MGCDMIELKSREQCRWDCIALGEVMLRLDPDDSRIRTTRHFRAWEGGGEYNVVRGLRRCFGQRTALVSALVDNDVGRLLEDLILQGGVDVSHIRWMPFDGTGRQSRNGLNFTERGFGLRPAKGCSDRGHTAASQLTPGDVDWNTIFRNEGVRWFHTGGVFSALSETSAEVTREAMMAAREAGTMISYDLNYRPSLWKDIGGQEKARQVNRELAGLVDVMIGNEEDFTASLGFDVEGVDLESSGDPLNAESFRKMIGEVVAEYPNFKAVATTLRNARTATINDWGAILYSNGEFYEAIQRPNLEIYDRVGGGDSFASGLIHGYLTHQNPERCVNYGAAHGALAMTTPGDTTMVTLSEVEKLMEGGSVRVDR
jgi:2-dehydro-3-deoxygluconokinase